MKNDARLMYFARKLWRYTPMIVFIIGWIPYAYGYKAMPILFSLPIFFQVIFKLLGVEFNLKRELIAYANTGFSGIYAQPTYYFDDHADHKYNKINQSQDTLNIHLEHELYFDHRE